MIPWISLVCVVNLPFFISDFATLGHSHPFSQICQGLVGLVYFFKEPAFWLIGSLYGFFFGLYLISFGPYIYYFSPSACFRFCLFLFF
jgi:hypothetical protein